MIRKIFLPLILGLFVKIATKIPNPIGIKVEAKVQINVHNKTLLIEPNKFEFLNVHHLPHCSNPTQFTSRFGGMWLNPMLVNDKKTDVITGETTTNNIKTQPKIEIIQGNPELESHRLE